MLLNLVRISLQATPPERRVAGIDAALAEQVFAPLFTTKPDGLGPGLNICRTIV